MKKTAKVKNNIKANLVWQGWQNLHTATLIFGFDEDYFPSDNPALKGRNYLDVDGYALLLAPLVSICKIDIQKYGSRSDLIASLIWNRIRQKAIKEEYEVWSSITAERTPLALLRNFDATRYASKTKKSLDVSGQPRELKLISNIAMKLIWPDHDGCTDLASVLYGLAILGAIKLLWEYRGCAICFRRAWPGRKYCSEHSQSQSDNSNRSRSYMNYRIGRKVKQLAIKRGLIEKLQGSAMQRSMESTSAMADMLFNSQQIRSTVEVAEKRDETKGISSHSDGVFYFENESIRREKVEWEFLKYTLQKCCPLTLRYIGGEEVINCSYANLLKTLRNKIDPYEWVENSWGVKIFACEIWLKLEAEVAPGKRGLGNKTLLRINCAIEMAAAGKSKVEIASELRVSPSSISKWLARKPELRGKL